MKKLENEFKETIINIKKHNNFATTSGKIIMNLCLINSNW